MDTPENAEIEKPPSMDECWTSFKDNVREGMSLINIVGINDQGHGEEAWNKIVNSFIKLLMTQRRHGSFAQPEFLFRGVSFQEDGVEATDDRKMQIGALVFRAAFFRMTDLVTSTTTPEEYLQLVVSIKKAKLQRIFSEQIRPSKN